MVSLTQKRSQGNTNISFIRKNVSVKSFNEAFGKAGNRIQFFDF